jgi:hypothetical protein
MNAVNGAVIAAWVIRILPVVLAILTTRGCMTEEQANAATPVLTEVINWVMGGAAAIAMLVGLLRSLKKNGTKKVG